jgi:hypothetical protein
MERYRNLGGRSAITHYEKRADGIRVRFQDGWTYDYDHVRPGWHHVERMKLLAASGSGLGAYISRNVRDRYARKELSQE